MIINIHRLMMFVIVYWGKKNIFDEYCTIKGNDGKITMKSEQKRALRGAINPKPGV